jgi:uridylate kinase
MTNRPLIMLKISGEQLGTEKMPFDMAAAKRIADVIIALRTEGNNVACVVGGGNVVRGPSLAREGFSNQVVADHMGMLATIQNALFLNEVLLDVLGDNSCVVMSNIHADTLVEPFSYRSAQQSISKGKVLLIAGGLGKPGFSTDTGVIAQAFELHCPMIVKTTKVDGVYDKDPEKFSDAKRKEHVTYEEALSNPNIQVMDKAAMAHAADKGIKIAICQPIPEHVISVVNGETKYGSIIG